MTELTLDPDLLTNCARKFENVIKVSSYYKRAGGILIFDTWVVFAFLDVRFSVECSPNNSNSIQLASFWWLIP